MTTFPHSPRLLKGGIVLMDPDTGAVLRVIALQYNSDTLTRSFQVKGVGAEGRRPRGGVATQSAAGRAATTIVALAAPFSKGWPLLFKSSQTTKITINPRGAVYEQRN